MVLAGNSGFLHYLQLSSRDLAKLYQKKWWWKKFLTTQLYLVESSNCLSYIQNANPLTSVLIYLLHRKKYMIAYDCCTTAVPYISVVLYPYGHFQSKLVQTNILIVVRWLPFAMSPYKPVVISYYECRMGMFSYDACTSIFYEFVDNIFYKPVIRLS